MAVGNDKILEKMLAELRLAKEYQDDQKTMLKHIQHIRLLCDLFLDEDDIPVKPKHKPDTMDEAEMKAMLGEKAYKTEKTKQQERKVQVDHDGANGSSIFDF